MASHRKTQCMDLNFEARKGNLDEVKKILDNRHNNPKFSSSEIYDEPLMFALHGTSTNHKQIAKLMIELGANPNEPGIDDTNGDPPLHVACGEGNSRMCAHQFGEEEKQVAQLLIKSGANVNGVDNRGQTVLHWACSSGHLEVAEFIVASGANVNAENKQGETPLHLASWHSHLSIVKWLLTVGAHANASDHAGVTPLQNAARRLNTELVSLLIEAGANVNAVSAAGFSSLASAVDQHPDQLGSPDQWKAQQIEKARNTIDLLIKSGAEISPKILEVAARPLPSVQMADGTVHHPPSDGPAKPELLAYLKSLTEQ